MTSPVAKAIGVLCRVGHWEPQSFLLCGWYWPSLLFFLAPSHLCTSWLFQVLGSVKSKWVLCLVFWNLVTGPTLFLPARGTLSQWGAGSACGMGWCSKTKLLFLHFCVVILLFCFGVFFLERGGLFCSLLYCIADASETYLRALPSCFCSCIAKYWSFGRDVGWGLPLCHLGDSSP